MCLLAVMSRVRADLPLVLAANRDELLARPAAPFDLLEPAAPRRAGGRDLVAGGTWLAVGEHGLVAGLTNRPVAGGYDPSRRSRGELPLLASAHPGARAAAEALGATLAADQYNPCWLLVADAVSAFVLEVGDAPRPRVIELPPGIHVLENRPPEAASPKAAAVAARLEALREAPAEALVERLRGILSSHELPPGLPAAGAPGADGRPRPPASEAPCVHLPGYGTRAATVVLGPAGDAPRIHHAEGPPCTAPLVPRDPWGRTRSRAWPKARRELEVRVGRPGLPADPELPAKFAAVALVLHEHAGELALLWIQRAESPRDPWSGQMGFPGGKGEPGDAGSLEAARRETLEELGLALDPGDWLGALAEVRARNRQGYAPFKVCPHVFWKPRLPELTPDPAEVARVHQIPLGYLAEPAHRDTLELGSGERKLVLPAIRWADRKIWGLSLRILQDLMTRLDAPG